MAKAKKVAAKKVAKKVAPKKKAIKYTGEGENAENSNLLNNPINEFEGLTEEQKISNIVNHKSAE